MDYQLIASGGLTDLNSLVRYEGQLAEGDGGLLELDLRLPVSQGVASELENKLRQAGIPDVRVVTASPLLQVYFRKGFPWLAVIAAAILGLIVLAILIMGWRLFKEVIPALPEPIQAIMGSSWFWVIAGGVVVILLLRRRR